MNKEGIRICGYGMNTEFAIKAYGHQARKAALSAVRELKYLEKRLSRFLTPADVYRLNRAAGKRSVRISAPTFTVLNSAISYSEILHGFFNVAIGPLMNLWHYRDKTVPEAEEIQKAFALMDFRDIVLDRRKQRAQLRRAGQVIDLGGIGKGYAGDQCIKRMKQAGITSASVDLGGNVAVLGSKPDGEPWRVGIRHPRKPGLLGFVRVVDKAVVTSGDYERYFIDGEGKRRHHLLNPATGYPVESGLLSVTIIADDGMAADAISTALFVAGLVEGRKILKQFPEFEAVLMNEKEEVFITEGLKECFESIPGIEVRII
jgi:thiamine biosynthesis lipoprotein